MEYDITLFEADKILGLITPARSSGFSHSSINQELGYKNGTPQSTYILAALKRLVDDNLLEKYSTNDSLFQITANTLDFKAKGSYQGLVDRENKKDQLKQALEELGFKSAQSVIDTNKSIQTLNTQTGDFYIKQTGFNKAQRNLTLAIVVFTFAQVCIATCQYLKPAEKPEPIQLPPSKEVEKELKKLKSKIESHIYQDSLFRQQVKDSLK